MKKSEIKSGMVIKYQGNKYLVGDINELGGVCDDCGEEKGVKYPKKSK